jgi:hypothetical protein
MTTLLLIVQHEEALKKYAIYATETDQQLLDW